MNTSDQIIDSCRAAFQLFLDQEADEVVPIASGHIHHSARVRVGQQDYLMQCVNENVFRNITAVMQNADALITHLVNSPNYPYDVATLYRTAQGETLVRNDAGAWRCQKFIAGQEPELGSDISVETVAYSFGVFSRVASEMPSSTLADTLPNFHNPIFRQNNHRIALANANEDRMAKARDINQRLTEFEFLADSLSTFRHYNEVAHNDPKPSNILVDHSGDPLAIIDFDTVMQGSRYDDFGDLVRSLCATAEENTDPTKTPVEFREDVFKEIYRGFLDGLKQADSSTVRQYFVQGSAYIIYEQALRFLTDFLSGNTYYKVEYEQQNLVRANNQLTLLESMDTILKIS